MPTVGGRWLKLDGHSCSGGGKGFTGRKLNTGDWITQIGGHSPPIGGVGGLNWETELDMGGRG